MKNFITDIVKNIIKESEEERNFLNKVKIENPSLYSRFYSIIKNKGLDIAKEKYQEYDPLIIKQKEKSQKKLDRQVSKIEKDAQSYSELSGLVEFLNLARKEIGANKLIANELKLKKFKLSGLSFNTYKSKDHITPLLNSNPNKLKHYINNKYEIPYETTEIYNKFINMLGGSDTIIIKSFIDFKRREINYSITFHLYSVDFNNNNMDSKIVNYIKDKWNGKYYNNLDEKLLYNVINDFVNAFKDQTIKDVKLSILARRN